MKLLHLNYFPGEIQWSSSWLSCESGKLKVKVVKKEQDSAEDATPSQPVQSNDRSFFLHTPGEASTNSLSAIASYSLT